MSCVMCHPDCLDGLSVSNLEVEDKLKCTAQYRCLALEMLEMLHKYIRCLKCSRCVRCLRFPTCMQVGRCPTPTRCSVLCTALLVGIVFSILLVLAGGR